MVMTEDSRNARPRRADLAIIGSGSGNSLLTDYWADKSVVIAEKGVFGGTCLNVGCIPTKMFVRPAEIARSGEEAARLNVTMQTTGVDWAGMRDRIFGRIDPISRGGRAFRADQQDNVELVEEQVRLSGPTSWVSASGEEVAAEQMVIAAGSRAVVPDVPGVDLPQVHTSDTVMRLEEQPERILIVGGGFIAAEFAAIFSGLGTAVTQVNRSAPLMKSADEEISRAFSEQAERTWDVRYGHTLHEVLPAASGAGVRARTATGQGSIEEHDVDVVLIALGRRPNTDLIGAAEAGLDLHADGRLAVDEYQRVLADGLPVPGVYALGDISSPHMLKHVANHEARVVAHNLENPEALRSSTLSAVPAAVFTHPEIAQVGVTETEAALDRGAENITVKVQQYGDTAYGWAMEDSQGIYKVIADRRTGEILGGHVLGYQASLLIQPVVQAMSFGQDAYTAARGQYWIHPALMEVAENALLGLDVPLPAHPPL